MVSVSSTHPAARRALAQNKVSADGIADESGFHVRGGSRYRTAVGNGVALGQRTAQNAARVRVWARRVHGARNERDRVMPRVDPHLDRSFGHG
jgi:hypothetical protein